MTRELNTLTFCTCYSSKCFPTGPIYFLFSGLDAGSIASLTGTLRGHNASGGGHHTPATTAYTITINSQAASSMDESILPLTEDKTRF